MKSQPQWVCILAWYSNFLRNERDKTSTFWTVVYLIDDGCHVLRPCWATPSNTRYRKLSFLQACCICQMLCWMLNSFTLHRWDKVRHGKIQHQNEGEYISWIVIMTLQRIIPEPANYHPDFLAPHSRQTTVAYAQLAHGVWR